MRIDYGHDNFDRKHERFEDVVFNDIGLCSCGDPDAVLDMLQEYLEAKQEWMPYEKQKEFASEHAEDLMLFMMYIMDDKGYTEHGTSVFSCWLTEEGRELLEMLKEK